MTVAEPQIPSIAESRAAVAELRPRTQLFIDGAFRDAHDGARYTTENPATGRPLAEVAQGGPADVDIAVAAARRAADDGRWSRVSPGDRKRILVRWADLIEANGRGDRPHRDARRGQAHHRHGRARRARDRHLHPLARGGRRQAVRPGRADARGHDRDDHPRAVRRRRRRHPVELPGPDGGLEARPGAGHRQHRRDQAGLDDVAEPAPDRRAGLRGGPAGRRAQRGHGPRRHRRRGASAGTRTSTASRSRARRRSAAGSSPTRRRRTSSACSWSSAARARSSCSRT